MILLAKIVEVSLTTIRLVFVSKGEKIYASTIGFVEVMIWLKVASVVLVDINEYPAKMIVYALGFALGNYIGLTIEDKIGLGYSNIQIIVKAGSGQEIADSIRKMGRAVTIVQGEGRDSKNVVLITYVKRKDKNVILSMIKEKEINGIVTVSETQKVIGGFGIK